MVVEQTPDRAIGDENLDPIAAELTAARLYVAQIERGEQVSANAALVMLGKMSKLRGYLDDIERVLTEHALSKGSTWVDIAQHTGRTSRQAAYQRYTRLGSSRVDITPAELSPEAIQRYGAPAWAEPAATPLDVADWPERQAQALIPFELDEQGWPINPEKLTGRTGRNLPKWGENQAADAMVFAGTGDDRKILLIQRDDTGVWALPGGMLDPGETSEEAMPRELYEEAGLDLSGHTPDHQRVSYVEDHRASNHSWVATTIGVYYLDEPAEIAAGDDAADAAWWPADDIQGLHIALTEAGGQLHRGHAQFIAQEGDRRNGW